MPAALNHTGKAFGRLTVVGRAANDRSGKTMWNCTCACGEACTIRGQELVRGEAQSCGCLQIELTSKRSGKHRETGTKLWHIWQGMISRCENTNHVGYANYGGRGIKVCDRWRHSYESFRDDIGPRPTPKHSIDRSDNDGNYEPGNVKWATRVEQRANRREVIE